jgi:hypothetical protein
MMGARSEKFARSTGGAGQIAATLADKTALILARGINSGKGSSFKGF